MVEKKSADEWIEYVGNCGTNTPFNKIGEKETCHINSIHEDPERCRENPEFYKHPGQRVKDPKLCLGKDVVDGFCRGKRKDDPCETHFECDVGLYCGNEMKCTEGIEETGHCDVDYHLCQSYLYCLEGTCVRYGSVLNGHNPGRGGEDLCETRYVNSRGQCDYGPKLKGQIFVDHRDSICAYTNDEEHPAVCGYHKDGKAICRPGAGDELMEKEWKDVNHFIYNIASHLFECQTNVPAICHYYGTMRLRHHDGKRSLR